MEEFNKKDISKLDKKIDKKVEYLSNLNDEDNDGEPEWANDNVEDFYNKKIEFKAIPEEKSSK